MICPTCKIEMDEGYVASKTRLQFVPKKEGKFPLTMYSLGKNAIPLSGVPMYCAKVKAFHCSKCQVIIITELVGASQNQN